MLQRESCVASRSVTNVKRILSVSSVVNLSLSEAVERPHEYRAKVVV